MKVIIVTNCLIASIPPKNPEYCYTARQPYFDAKCVDEIHLNQPHHINRVKN
jgi:hypothetical protein